MKQKMVVLPSPELGIGRYELFVAVYIETELIWLGDY